jgi:di/tricarboxylate transporter
MFEQAIIFTVLLVTLILFIWGRWRYDVVALLALLTVTVTGIIPSEEAFAGFGHPAVITVAAVLVLSRALQNSGVVDVISRLLLQVGQRITVQIGALTGLVAAMSAFMNNTGALALLMPVAIRMARKNDQSPSLYLMPLAFASLLGGLITLIGTPPNIIIATFRADQGLEPFRMFDFAPVGLGVAIAGVLFITLAGWRLPPQRRGQATAGELFEIGNYVTEVRLTEASKLAGQRLRDLPVVAKGIEVVVVAIIRDGHRQLGPTGLDVLLPGDLLLIEADSENLAAFIHMTGVELVGSKAIGDASLDSEDFNLMEAVVKSGSVLVNRSARTLNLRWRYGVNLLAVARQGVPVRQRLSDIILQAGDVLLLQGPSGTLHEVLPRLDCLPLAQRGLRLGQPRRVVLAVAIFAGALLLAAFGLVQVQVAFMAAVVLMLLTNLISLREAYESIDWPIIVLLAAMIPVGQALEVTGGAAMLANSLLLVAGRVTPLIMLSLVLVATMFLSDLVNNAAAAVLMAPIAIGVAAGIGASIDPFLMAVTIGASCAFLTPIGHQSNTLVMGPGGYRFGDYWRLGLPLEIIILVVAVPLIAWFWPLGV